MQSLAAEVAPSIQSSAPTPTRGFVKFAWAVLGYNVLVVLWGALVRATKSGAGCGGHWPLCNGDVLPQISQVATVIEFTHRIMSGVALMVVIGLFVWAWKAFPKGHLGRRWAALSFVFIITEALIGAALVLLGHVAMNESVGRVYSLGTHLVNTFLLLASLALTAWHATISETPHLGNRRTQPLPVLRQDVPTMLRLSLLASIAGLVLVAMAGVITALGDTLFPSHTLSDAIAQDFSSTANFLIRLRVIHPALAVLISCYIAVLAIRQYALKDGRRLWWIALTLVGLIGLQIVAGVMTIILQAPVYMQIVHLFLADALWITLVIFTSEQLREGIVTPDAAR
jgi:heme a synthase